MNTSGLTKLFPRPGDVITARDGHKTKFWFFMALRRTGVSKEDTNLYLGFVAIPKLLGERIGTFLQSHFFLQT